MSRAGFLEKEWSGKGGVDKRKERVVLGSGWAFPAGRRFCPADCLSSVGGGEAQEPGGLPGADQRVPGWLRGCVWESVVLL